ncbi:hypothetical protein A9Q84_09230 [Halobacteriovorax marinus]|uniref:Uncharacterized protein n=1 Tax=Halobacteriovorax marinus TaxID=97084 RepID=A0A1Y5FAK6_9BACT|nr:hypothetical protein A9Q84_09230 [Halobacteriovorax marinus]
MEYLITLFPLILLIPLSLMKGPSAKSFDNIIQLIEGKDFESPRRPDDLYRATKLLLEMRKLYGSKVNAGLMLLKQEVFKAKWDFKHLQALMHGAYFQQLTMLILIIAMVLITNTMFETPVWSYVVLAILQVVAVVFLHLSAKALSKMYVHGGRVRFNNLLIIQCLSISGLSVSKVLSYVNWAELDETRGKKFEEWDRLFSESLYLWQQSGTGLEQKLKELTAELKYLRESHTKSYKDFLSGSKFISLLISGFVSYFVYLYSFMSKFIG